METELGTRILMNYITRISVNTFGIPAKLKVHLNDGHNESGVLKAFDFKNNFNSDGTITLILFDEGKEGDEMEFNLKDIHEITKL